MASAAPVDKENEGQGSRMPKNKYPKGITTTSEGKALYHMWLRVREETEEFSVFTEFPNFYYWAMDHDFCPGAKLRRYDETLPFSPENCWFLTPKNNLDYLSPAQKARANEWNKTVNVIRKACRMKLFEAYDEEEMYV